MDLGSTLRFSVIGWNRRGSTSATSGRQRRRDSASERVGRPLCACRALRHEPDDEQCDACVECFVRRPIPPPDTTCTPIKHSSTPRRDCHRTSAASVAARATRSPWKPTTLQATSPRRLRPTPRPMLARLRLTLRSTGARGSKASRRTPILRRNLGQCPVELADLDEVRAEHRQETPRSSTGESALLGPQLLLLGRHLNTVQNAGALNLVDMDTGSASLRSIASGSEDAAITTWAQTGQGVRPSLLPAVRLGDERRLVPVGHESRTRTRPPTTSPPGATSTTSSPRRAPRT